MLILTTIWRVLRCFWGWFWRLVALVVFLFLMQRSTYPAYIESNAISLIAGSNKFDYVSWEISALVTKTAQTLWGVQPFMDEADRSQYVRDYMADLGRARELEAAIDAVYLDPGVDDPDTQTLDQRRERDALRNDLADRQTLVESILEGQVAVVLADEGFGMIGQMLPPVSMHFTQMPNLLVVSPRDRIERRVELALDPMPLEEIIVLEDRIRQERNMDALVVPLGGMALYPAMIQESANIPWAVETFAHEWVHHYFFFYPLGLSFFVDTGPSGREALTINETAANIFGREIGQKVAARFYPEYAQPESAANMLRVNFSEQTGDFDFGRAMHQTRTTVDSMLNLVELLPRSAEDYRSSGSRIAAAGTDRVADLLVDWVGIYMEGRRQLFVANGYKIRRLNLAYFAFYGGYQAEGVPGIAGDDPTGPAIEEIFAMSQDLHAFVITLRGITSQAELLAVRDAMRAGHS